MVTGGTDPELQLSGVVAEIDDVEPPEDAPLSGTCKICRLEGPGYEDSDVFSSSFTSANKCIGGDCICYRCKYMADQTDYRRYHWILSGDEIEITKDREELLETLLDPPEGRWMVKVTSDFLNTLNGWMDAQTLNLSRERFSVLYDEHMVDFEREELEELVEYARDLRDRGVAKGTMKSGPTASDMEQYDLRPEDIERIDKLSGRGDWELIVKLVQ